MKQPVKKVCTRGHVFFKSSTCPVCPICEKQNPTPEGFLALISAPARRALEAKGIRSTEQLSRLSERELSSFHGVGPKVMDVLRRFLADNGMSFKEESTEGTDQNHL